MADYKKMYITLFNGMTDAIDTLQSAQQETEEMYLEGSEPDLRFVEPRDPTKKLELDDEDDNKDND